MRGNAPDTAGGRVCIACGMQVPEPSTLPVLPGGALRLPAAVRRRHVDRGVKRLDPGFPRQP